MESDVDIKRFLSAIGNRRETELFMPYSFMNIALLQSLISENETGEGGKVLLGSKLTFTFYFTFTG